MSSKNSQEEKRPKSTPNLVYVVDGHGEGWYCTNVDPQEEEPTSGECTHEDEVPYARDFGG